MSRLYFTAEMKYKDGIKLPVFRIWTGDHTGGTYHIGGLYPSTIATMTGKGPQYADQERFDLKFNVNKTRANASLICNTTKHLPAVSWSTDTGMSKLPLGIGTLGAALLGKKVNAKLIPSEKSRRSLPEPVSRRRSSPPKAIESGQSYNNKLIEDRHRSRSNSTRSGPGQVNQSRRIEDRHRYRSDLNHSGSRQANPSRLIEDRQRSRSHSRPPNSSRRVEEPHRSRSKPRLANSSRRSYDDRSSRSSSRYPNARQSRLLRDQAHVHVEDDARHSSDEGYRRRNRQGSRYDRDGGDGGDD